MWYIHPGDARIIEEISQQTDRGAALIAAAYLEERLLDAIKSRLHEDGGTIGRLFAAGYGPLSDFAAKIDLGRALGVYGDKACRALHCVRKIRNRFAHESEPLQFETQAIRDLCRNLAPFSGLAIRSVSFESDDPPQAPLRVDFECQEPGSPLEGYLTAVKFLLLLLQVELAAMPARRPEEPLFDDDISVPPSA